MGSIAHIAILAHGSMRAAEPRRLSLTGCSAFMREPPVRSGLHATRPDFCNGTNHTTPMATAPVAILFAIRARKSPSGSIPTTATPF